MEITLPLTRTGRKYGYITWSKAEDSNIRTFLGEAQIVTLLLADGPPKRRNIDWKHRRISVGYSITRPLSVQIKTIWLKSAGPGRVEVSFR